MHRPDISRLRKNRGINMKIAFILSLSVVIFAFNWTSEINVVKENSNYIVEDIDEIPVVRTKEFKKKLPPPPAIEASPEPVIEDMELTTDPIPETIEDPTLPEPPEPPKETSIAPAPKPVPLPMPEPPKKFAPEEDVFTVVEEMPRFPGCEEQGMTKAEKQVCAEKKMLQFIYERIRYPQLARETGTAGTAVLQFVIEKDGRITDIQIARDPGGGLGKEALRVVKTMPNWNPGKQRNKPVRVKYSLPVKYILE